jgi:ankyrin repeat protein
MKFKFISLLLAFSLQSLAMEQGNSDDGQKNKTEETQVINREKSLGTLAIFPNETLLKILHSSLENLNYQNACQFLQTLKLVSKQFKLLAEDITIQDTIKLLQIIWRTKQLTVELNKDLLNWTQIKELIQQGADVNVVGKQGITALMWAAGNGYQDTVELFLDKNADVNTEDNNGYTALIHAANNGYKNVVKLLLDKNININAVNMFGYTALIHAASNGYKDIVKLLLDKNANVNIVSRLGSTALDRAAKNGYKEIAELLREHGAL